MTTSITFRTDAELKAEVEDILEDIGMNMSTAFNCFLAKIRAVGGIPFTLSRKSKHQRLMEAYNEARKVANDPNAQTCTDPDKIEECMLAGSTESERPPATRRASRKCSSVARTSKRFPLLSVCSPWA